MQRETTLSQSWTSTSSARLVSTSPPDHIYHDIYGARPHFPTNPSPPSPEPAVLPISEVVHAPYVQPVNDGHSGTDESPLLPSWPQQRTPRAWAADVRLNTDSTDELRQGSDAEHHSKATRCVHCAELFLDVAAVLCGSGVVAVALLCVDRVGHVVRCSVSPYCCIISQLQTSVLLQGALLILMGMLGLCRNLTSLLFRRSLSTGVRRRLRCLCTNVLFSLAMCGYALFVVSVAYVVWQVLSSSVGSHQCVWQVYVGLAVEELVTALFFTASITVSVCECIVRRE